MNRVQGAKSAEEVERENFKSSLDSLCPKTYIILIYFEFTNTHRVSIKHHCFRNILLRASKLALKAREVAEALSSTGLLRQEVLTDSFTPFIFFQFSVQPTCGQPGNCRQPGFDLQKGDQACERAIASMAFMLS